MVGWDSVDGVPPFNKMRAPQLPVPHFQQDTQPSRVVMNTFPCAATSPSKTGGDRSWYSAIFLPSEVETAHNKSPLRPSKAPYGSSLSMTSGGPARRSVSPARTMARARTGIFTDHFGKGKAVDTVGQWLSL